MNNQMVVFYIIAFIIVLFIVFIIFRELNCWYWKINRKIELHRQTNILLEKIFMQLGGTTDNTADKLITTKLESIDGVNLESLNSLTPDEKKELHTLLVYNQGSFGIIVAINIKSRKFSVFSENKWNNLKNSIEFDEWRIIINKK